MEDDGISSEVPFPKIMPGMDLKTLNLPDEKEWNGPFDIIVGADSQFGFIARELKREASEARELEMKLLEKTVKMINNMDPLPRFFAICGDMLDAFPYKGDEEDARKKQYADLTPILNELDPKVKLICICGNHDIGDIPTEHTVQVYREQFGPDFFSFWVGGVKFVVLNSQYFKSPDAVPEETEKHERFINAISDSDGEKKAKHLVVFQHIPFFLKDAYEDTEYFNLEKDMRLQRLEMLYESGCRYIFCGHYHRNAGGFYKDLELVVTSAIGGQLGNDPSGFRIVKILQDKITHEYIPIKL